MTGKLKRALPGATARYDGTWDIAPAMSRLDRYLVFAESHRLVITAVSALMIAATAWLDWFVPDSSMGFLYLVPILVSAAALSNREFLLRAMVCGYLREIFAPLQGVDRVTDWRLRAALNPANWPTGSFGRLVVAVTGFAM